MDLHTSSSKVRAANATAWLFRDHERPRGRNRILNGRCIPKSLSELQVQQARSDWVWARGPDHSRTIRFWQAKAMFKQGERREVRPGLCTRADSKLSTQTYKSEFRTSPGLTTTMTDCKQHL